MSTLDQCFDCTLPRSGVAIAGLESNSRYEPLKVAADFVLATVLLVVTAPLILVLMGLVKLTSRGPAIYSQVRLGLRGRPFSIYKIRTMADDCERLSGPCWSTAGD